MALAGGSLSVVPASKYHLILDSKYKDEKELCTHFTAKLNAALRGRIAAYNLLSWSQPIYCHNAKSSQLIFAINGSDTGEENYFCVFAPPFTIFKEFDGNPDGTFFGEPTPGSYCFAMEYAFNNDIRLLTDPQIVVNPTVNGGQTLQFYFRYSPSHGFHIYCKRSGDDALVGLQLMPSPWLDFAHNVHGFGLYDQTTNTILPSQTEFSTLLVSDKHPLLVYTRYVVIVVAELNQNRQFLSIVSGIHPEFEKEVAVFQLSHLRTNVFQNQAALEDATKIKMKFGVEPQQLEIKVLDEEGSVLIPSNHRIAFLSDPTIPPEYKDSLLFAPFYSKCYTDLCVLNYFKDGKFSVHGSLYQHEVYSTYDLASPGVGPATSYTFTLKYDEYSEWIYLPLNTSKPLHWDTRNNIQSHLPLPSSVQGFLEYTFTYPVLSIALQNVSIINATSGRFVVYLAFFDYFEVVDGSKTIQDANSFSVYILQQSDLPNSFLGIKDLTFKFEKMNRISAVKQKAYVQFWSKITETTIPNQTQTSYKWIAFPASIQSFFNNATIQHLKYYGDPNAKMVDDQIVHTFSVTSE